MHINVVNISLRCLRDGKKHIYCHSFYQADCEIKKLAVERDEHRKTKNDDHDNQLNTEAPSNMWKTGGIRG